MADGNGTMVYERWWELETDLGTFYVRAWHEDEALALFILWVAYGPVEVDWLRTSSPLEEEN